MISRLSNKGSRSAASQRDDDGALAWYLKTQAYRWPLEASKPRTEIASEKQFATIGEPIRKVYRKRSGLKTVRILSDEIVNVNDPKKGVTKQAKMVTVVDSPADVNYVRRNILTKGAVVETDVGKVRLTSRPGKDGVLNGTLLEE